MKMNYEKTEIDYVMFVCFVFFFFNLLVLNHKHKLLHFGYQLKSIQMNHFLLLLDLIPFSILLKK